MQHKSDDINQMITITECTILKWNCSMGTRLMWLKFNCRNGEIDVAFTFYKVVYVSVYVCDSVRERDFCIKLLPGNPGTRVVLKKYYRLPGIWSLSILDTLLWMNFRLKTTKRKWSTLKNFKSYFYISMRPKNTLGNLGN